MRISLGAISALLLVACAATVGRVDGPVLTGPPDPHGRDALLQGTLTFDSDRGCLLLERDGMAYPVLWPAGSRWQASPPGVVLPNGQMVGVGMSVTGGGGYLPLDLIERRAGSQVADAAAACLGAADEIALFNSEGEITIGSN